MSLARKGFFSTPKKDETYAFCLVNPKHLQAIIFLLSLLAVFLSVYIFTIFKKDFLSWQSSQVEHLSQRNMAVTVEQIWVKPNEPVYKLTKLLSVSIDKNSKQGEKIVNKLQKKMEKQLAEVSVNAEKLQLNSRLLQQKLTFQLSTTEKAIDNLRYYDITPKAYINSDLSSEEILSALQHKADLIARELTELPYQLKRKTAKNNRLISLLLSQIARLKKDQHYTVFAEHEGVVEHIMVEEGKHFLLESPLLVINSQQLEKQTHVYLAQLNNSLYSRLVGFK